MIVIGLDGREYTFVPSSNESKGTRRSKLHMRAFQVMRETYPHAQVLEEVSLPGSRLRGGKTLRADLFLPFQQIVVEVHGEQHYTFNAFHYKDKRDFLKAKARDAAKKNWCELNNFVLVEFPYNETDEQWKERLC